MADAKRRFLLPDQLQQFEDSVRVICVRVRDNNGIKSGNAALFQIRENPFSPIADALLLPPSFSIRNGRSPPPAHRPGRRPAL